MNSLSMYWFVTRVLNVIISQQQKQFVLNNTFTLSMKEIIYNADIVIIKHQQSKINLISHAVNVIIKQYRKEIIKYLYRLSVN